MRATRLLRALIWLGLGCFLVGMVVPVASAWTSPDCRSIAPEVPYDLAVVLAAGGTRDPLPSGESRERIEAAIALYDAGHLRAIHMTGDGVAGPAHAVADQMGRLAIEEGLPQEILTVEPASRSTLENALFSADRVEEADRVILVTTGYHLWRGAMSLAWAGTPPDALCHPNRMGVATSVTAAAEVAALESIKLWANLARAGLWSLMQGVGLTPPENMLR
ncbi:YdcF family protein [Histidinibacterium aquaticum]|uniref:YdcF family protein n=1 Tax=Histidinibacterium aquaticum TaxID=2613962 RepID=A0A5J5GME6_9RHOB|nr:YdcF family protein [Histidinibacterium aquaticum]KAA9009217.1 YdcF family protein [Histidinibacterium aquaticum]